MQRNLCITLVIYQESLHDARSTKCKIKKWDVSTYKRTVIYRRFEVSITSTIRTNDGSDKII